MDYPEVIVIDVDGVLTDGKLTIDHRGEKLFKSFHTRDVRAIRELVANGIEVYLVSADEWAGSRHFADKVGAEFMYMRDKKRLVEMLANRRWGCIGDDAWDVALLQGANMAFCPADADVSVKKIRHITVLETRAGAGCIAEIVTLLLGSIYAHTPNHP